QRRDVPDHGQGAVLRVQRQGHPAGVDQGVDRRALGGLDPVVRDAGAFGGGDHARVVGGEEDLPLRHVDVGVLGRGGGFEHAVGAVEHYADAAQAVAAG